MSFSIKTDEGKGWNLVFTGESRKFQYLFDLEYTAKTEVLLLKRYSFTSEEIFMVNGNLISHNDKWDYCFRQFQSQIYYEKILQRGRIKSGGANFISPITY